MARVTPTAAAIDANINPVQLYAGERSAPFAGDDSSVTSTINAHPAKKAFMCYLRTDDMVPFAYRYDERSAGKRLYLGQIVIRSTMPLSTFF
jgi:hypothetical protein